MEIQKIITGEFFKKILTYTTVRPDSIITDFEKALENAIEKNFLIGLTAILLFSFNTIYLAEDSV